MSNKIECEMTCLIVRRVSILCINAHGIMNTCQKKEGKKIEHILGNVFFN